MLAQLNYFPKHYFDALTKAASKFKCEIRVLGNSDNYCTLTVEISDYTELFLLGMFCGNDVAKEAVGKVIPNIASNIASEILVNFKP